MLTASNFARVSYGASFRGGPFAEHALQSLRYRGKYRRRNISRAGSKLKNSCGPSQAAQSPQTPGSASGKPSPLAPLLPPGTSVIARDTGLKGVQENIIELVGWLPVIQKSINVQILLYQERRVLRATDISNTEIIDLEGQIQSLSNDTQPGPKTLVACFTFALDQSEYSKLTEAIKAKASQSTQYKDIFNDICRKFLAGFEKQSRYSFKPYDKDMCYRPRGPFAFIQPRHSSDSFAPYLSLSGELVDRDIFHLRIYVPLVKSQPSTPSGSSGGRTGEPL